MSEIIAITSTTLQDLNDAIIAGKEPVGELEDGILWLDTSKTPPVLKIRENGNGKTPILILKR